MDLNLPTPDSVANQSDDGTISISKQWYSFFSKVKNWIVGNSQSGSTANRPTSNLDIGYQYYDTTLGCPVWVHSLNPVVWHNGAGAVV